MNKRIDWNQYREEFAWDGSRRDIYGLNTDFALWQRFLDFIRFSGYPYRFSLGGDPASLPEDVKGIFEAWKDRGPLLCIDVGGVTLSCHFFTQQEIEFDLDPREVTGEQKAGPSSPS